MLEFWSTKQHSFTHAGKELEHGIKEFSNIDFYRFKNASVNWIHTLTPFYETFQFNSSLKVMSTELIIFASFDIPKRLLLGSQLAHTVRKERHFVANERAQARCHRPARQSKTSEKCVVWRASAFEQHSATASVKSLWQSSSRFER